MRVIAGNYKSRTLDAPAGRSTRPTSDRLRETLFNVLAARIEGARFLDLYAGSGAVGIEALSRGAARAEFVERAQPALKTLRANLARLGIRAGFGIHAVNAAAFLKRIGEERFDLVFLDPPYDAAEEYEQVLMAVGAVLAEGGLAIAEHRKKNPPEETYGALKRVRLLKQGDAALSFYEVEATRV